jgi:diguanylate cyclase (GGDEF)-like protein
MTARLGRILVVDDDPIVRELVSESLEAHGLDAICASEGEEGLKLARQEKPDLVLLDVRMPGMDGLEVCRQLRRGFRTCTIPIIILTSLSQTADKVEGMLVGADDYVTKPFDPQELIARVTTHLERSERDIQTNPLTRLPGNLAVERSIEDRIGTGAPFAVCYFDLDNFKPYNSKYGFVAGDVVIQMLGDLIVRAVLEHGNDDDFVGHEGGDDFVVVTTPDKAKAICEAVISAFDEMIPAQYNEEDRAQGYFLSRDRRGNEIAFPLMSVSGAIVTNERRKLVHPGQAAQIAAEVLAHVKGLEGSNYLLDRRRNDEGEPPQEV